MPVFFIGFVRTQPTNSGLSEHSGFHGGPWSLAWHGSQTRVFTVYREDQDSMFEQRHHLPALRRLVDCADRLLRRIMVATQLVVREGLDSVATAVQTGHGNPLTLFFNAKEVTTWLTFTCSKSVAPDLRDVWRELAHGDELDKGTLFHFARLLHLQIAEMLPEYVAVQLEQVKLVMVTCVVALRGHPPNSLEHEEMLEVVDEALMDAAPGLTITVRGAFHKEIISNINTIAD
eukprot:NODE_1101_length_1284_cov_7.676923_g901_i0.p1 GENE.NODE_1101_length_1284_cov_7.676923_g901_i0~~NODE_1101_length_1284_cov_7.676923_g901_i0.p1  ORF type:complete len:232 (-),score=51.14 NODE_1101_length_1284_cov_7.676923_g901_i0:215-910(-)